MLYRPVTDLDVSPPLDIEPDFKVADYALDELIRNVEARAREEERERIIGMVEKKREKCELCSDRYDETCEISVKNYTLHGILAALRSNQTDI